MYLITTLTFPPFTSDYFEAENCFNPDPNINMVVYNLSNMTFTEDGKTWKEITQDHL